MIRNRENVKPFVTKDGSTVRELYQPGSSPAHGCSVAEACVGRGEETEVHLHRRSQEFYYILEGSGTMRLGDERLVVRPGDAILIPPGTSHNVRAESRRLRILCICTPPYADDDTFLQKK